MKTSSRVALAALLTALLWIIMGFISILLIKCGVPSALCAAIQCVLIIIASIFIGKAVI